MTDFDSWENDMLERTATEDEPQLPRTLAELRDGTAPPPANAGHARQRRLQQMEADDIALTEFLSDLDRYIDHMKSAEYVGQVVGPYMAKYVGDERNRLASKQTKLRAELAYLRAIS